MNYFFQIITVVMTLFLNSAYASDPMEQFQANLEKITHNLQGTLAVSKAGKIFYSKVQGQCSSEKACDMDTQYAIGFVTKQFTAAALLRVLYDKVCERNAERLQKELHQPVIHFLNNNDEIWPEGKAPEWSKKRYITCCHTPLA